MISSRAAAGQAGSPDTLQSVDRSPSASRRAPHATSALLLLSVVCLAAVLGSGCVRRFIVAEPHAVSSEQPADSAVATTERVLSEERYEVLEKDTAQRRFKVLAKVSGRSAPDQRSFISIAVDDAGVALLQPEGHLVQAGKVHRNLDREVRKLAKLLARGFENPTPANGESTMNAAAASSPAASSPAGSDGAANLPSSWIEVSSAPQTWGTGEFTCLPLDLPESAAAELSLQLSSGEPATLTITLARGAGLCEKQCRIEAGCVALGLGDDAEVEAVAKLIAGGQATGRATLLQAEKPLANVELDRHGSFKEPLVRAKAALSESK